MTFPLNREYVIESPRASVTRELRRPPQAGVKLRPERRAYETNRKLLYGATA